MMSKFEFFLLLISIQSLDYSLAIEPSNQNDQPTWGFGNLNFLPLSWLYNDNTTNQSAEDHNISNPKPEIASTEDPTIPERVITTINRYDDTEPSKRVDDLLDMIRQEIGRSSDDEKKYYETLLTQLEKQLENNPSRFIKVFLKKMWYSVDLGIFQSNDRIRNISNVQDLIQKIKEILYQIYNYLYDLFYRLTGKKPGFDLTKPDQVQLANANFEREQANDRRLWTEDQVLRKIEEMKSQLSTIDKETAMKDVTSLCMQPMHKVGTYDKIAELLEIMKQSGFDTSKITKAESLLRYKWLYSQRNNIV